MSQLHIPLSSDIPVKDVLSDMPAAPKAFVKKGFSVIAKLPETAHAALLKSVIKTIKRNAPLGSDEQLARDLGISVEETTSAVASLGMFSSLITSAEKETADEIFQAVVDSGLISASEKPSLQRIVPKITQAKPEISKAIATQRLLDAVLPSFNDLDVVLDIRIGDKEHGGLGMAIPMAVAYLDTDTRDQRLWFQLSKEDVESMIEKLNDLLKRFREAEELVAKFPPGGKA